MGNSMEFDIFFSISQQHKVDPVAPIDKASPTFPNYSNGEYKPIIQLMDLMPNSLLAKAYGSWPDVRTESWLDLAGVNPIMECNRYTDIACNDCGVLLNLRLHIETCVARISTAKETDARTPAYWRKQAEAGLLRYYSSADLLCM